MVVRRLCLALVLIALEAWPRDKLVEVRQALDGLDSGTLSATQAANRISFVGGESLATDALSLALRQGADARRRALYLEVLAQVATPHPELTGFATAATRAPNDLTTRMAGIRILGRMKQATSLPTLTPLLTDKLLGVRREAARALIVIKAPAAAPALLEAAKTEDDPELRAVMIVGVGRLGDAKQARGLEALSTSSSESTRVAVIQALCLLGNKKGLEAARAMLTSKDKEERVQGVLLLDGAPAKQATPLLTPLLEDPEVSVRARAGRVLAQGGDVRVVEWMVIESFRSSADARLTWETELEQLRLSDDQRGAILRKAGLKK